MYLGSSDAIYLAEEIAELVINGQMSQALRQIKEKELNSVQAMYIMGLMNGNFVMDAPLLNKSQIDSLMRALSNYLNENS
jgi:hypothetical protein